MTCFLQFFHASCIERFAVFNLPLSPSAKNWNNETGDGRRRPSSANANSDYRLETNGSYSFPAMTVSNNDTSRAAINSNNDNTSPSFSLSPRSTSAMSPRGLDFAAGSARRDLKLGGGTPRKPQNLPSFGGFPAKSPDSVEIERKYQEIMKQCGILSLGNEVGISLLLSKFSSICF